MLKKIKLRLLLIAVIAIIGTLLSQTSLAYYTTTGKAVNVVTSGSIKMQIVEKGEGDTEYPKEGIYIMPGDVVSKRVSVKSLSEHPFYLRVKIVYGINSTLFEGLFAKLLSSVALFTRFDSITSGMFDITAVILYITTAVLFCFLTKESMEKRRWS